MNKVKTSPIALAAGISLVLSGCGGSSYDNPPSGGNPNPNPTSPTPISVVGTIDGFGSIFVGGIEFETDSASYRVDDEDAFDDSSLSVGMIVKVEGTASDDGTGRASSIYYDDDLEGPVEDLGPHPTDAAKAIFTLFGTSVTVSSVTTVFRAEDDPDFGFDTLADGDHVEVSGEYHDGMLAAAFVKKEDGQDEDFEAKGTVSAFNDVDRFTLTLASGSTLDITLALGADIPTVGISNGQFVEIEGTIPAPVTAPRSLSVTKVELEDRRDFDDDDDEVKIESILSFDGSAWSVGTNDLAFDNDTEYRPQELRDAVEDGTADGRHVEVRGQFVDGVLLVERIRIEEDNLEIKGFVQSVGPANATIEGTVTLSFSPATGTLPVIVDSNTMFVDGDSVNQFDLSDLSPGVSFVEIHAHFDEAGDVVAGLLDLEDSPDEYEIEGPLDADGFVDGVSVSVLGVTFSVGPGTFYEDGTPVNGDIIDVEDFERDGIADSVDVED